MLERFVADELEAKDASNCEYCVFCVYRGFFFFFPPCVCCIIVGCSMVTEVFSPFFLSGRLPGIFGAFQAALFSVQKCGKATWNY